MGGCAAVLGLSAESAPSRDPQVTSPTPQVSYPPSPTDPPCNPLPSSPVSSAAHQPRCPLRGRRTLPVPPSLAALWAEGRLLKTCLDLPFLGAKEAGGTPDSTSRKEAFVTAVVPHPPGHWEVGLAPWMLNLAEGILLPHSRGHTLLSFSTDC